jgi:hypothetical protein
VAAQRLRPGDAAARMKPSTRTSLVRSYGYLLEFCRRNGFFDQHAGAGAHVMPELIDAFVDELRNRVGSVTRAIYIEKIHRIAMILAPERDLVWVREIEGDLRYEARPLEEFPSSRRNEQAKSLPRRPLPWREQHFGRGSEPPRRSGPCVDRQERFDGARTSCDPSDAACVRVRFFPVFRSSRVQVSEAMSEPSDPCN